MAKSGYSYLINIRCVLPFYMHLIFTLSRPKPDTRISDHDWHVNIKPKPGINKNQLNLYKTFTKASLFLFILVSLLK